MRSRRFVVRLALCLLLSFVAVGALAQCVPQPGVGTNGQVIVLGDSISAGCCAPTEETWPAIFAGRLRADLVNVAIGGETSDSLISELRAWPSGRTQSQLDEALSLIDESQNVAAVTLGIGTNDGFQTVWLRDPDSGELCALDPTTACEELVQAALDSFRANLHSILGALRTALEPETPLLVMTVYLGGRDQPLNTLIVSEIAEHNAVLADVAEHFDELELSELLVSDGIHTGAAGHAVIADVFTNAMPPDSDGDGLSDLMEEVAGSDP